MINFKFPMIPSFAILKGFVKMVDGSKIPDDISMSVDVPNAEEPLRFKPRRMDGGFVMTLDPCSEYEIEYYRGDTILKKQRFKVPCGAGYQEIYKELYIDTLFLAVITPEEAALAADTIKPKAPTAYFEQYFMYNKNKADDKKEYQELLSAIKAQVKVNGKSKIRIEASASRVPTSSFPSNDALAVKRADNFKVQLLKDLKKLGIKESAVEFISIKSSVQGPAYANDYDANSVAYGKFQYIKAWAE